MRRTGVAVLLALALLVALRAALPFGLARYVNRVLDRTEGYRGQVGDIDVALYRGAYRIERVELEDASGNVPVPLFAADAIDLSVQWRALLRGELVGEVELVRTVVNLVAGPTEATTQTGTRPHWSERLEELFPMRIDRFSVRDGTLRFRDPWREPAVDVGLTDLEVVARNLTNVREVSAEKPADVEITATAFRSGTLRATLALDPLSREPDFMLRGRVDDVSLPELNAFFRAYGGFDAERGELTLLTEIDCDGGAYRGYLKPLVTDLDVLYVADEAKEQGALDTLWEALFGGTAELIENQLRDQQGARIPVKGSFDDPQIGIWAALESLLRNGFLGALEPRFDRLTDREAGG